MLSLPVSLRMATSRAVACGDCVRVRTATAAVRFVVVQIINNTKSNEARVISVPAAVFPSLIASNDHCRSYHKEELVPNRFRTGSKIWCLLELVRN